MQLILIRHGQSESNIDKTILSKKPDHLIELTYFGRQQALNAGNVLNKLGIKTATFFVSPFLRAKQTLDEINKSVNSINTIEDIRLREQDIGNFIHDISVIHEERSKHSRFFYRFPNGESCADVFIRVQQFLTDNKRQFMYATNPIIVTHAATMRVFEMICKNLTYQEFDRLKKPANASILKLEI